MKDKERWFWLHVIMQPDGCWRWEGARANGYGVMTDESGKRAYAHLWAHEHFVGPRPAGLVADHQCHQPPCRGGMLCVHRRCCNPAHIKFVTNKENFLRNSRIWHSMGKTCKNGHPWESNTRILSSGKRQCIACQNKRSLDAYYRAHPEKKDRRHYL